MTVLQKEISIRQLGKDDPVPYGLLLDADPSKELVDKYLAKSEVYIVAYKDRIIGVYVLYPLSTTTIEIKNIAVAGSLQGKGIGQCMLKDAFQKATQKGFKEIIIGTANSSIGQLYLYQKAGFEITEIKKNFFTKNYSKQLYENGLKVKHMIILAKALSPAAHKKLY